MDPTEIIEVEYEAIKRFSQGDRKVALKVIQELGAFMRDYFRKRSPNKVTPDELCEALEGVTISWKQHTHA